jgi:ABC-type amino acid transport substrate-binding protein
MGKILGSVAFLIAIIVGGFVYDPGFHAKVTGMFSKGQTAAVAGGNDWAKSVAPEQKSSSDGTLASIIDKGVVRVSVQSPSVPFYSVVDGKPKGFNVDFMKMLFAQSEFKGKITIDTDHAVDTYADVPKQLLTGKVDIAIDGLTFNNDDLPGVVYSIPYVKDFGYSLITTKGNVIQSAADVVGMKVGVLQGDPDVRAFVEQAFPGAKIVELSDKADANGKWIVGHFKAHTVDAVVYDYPFAVAEVDGTGILQFAMTKIKGSDIQYRIGMRKGDTDLLAAVNSAIRKVMDSEAYPNMLKTYFMSTNVALVRRASSGEVSYIVSKGDTLSTIAQSQLGDIKRYTDIQARNNLANPNFITVGQKLVIPSK